MRKQDLFKRAAVLALAGALVMGNAMPSFAAGWQWLDENNDGIAECYYFDEGGHKLTGTTTPDGYTVNADGAWVENGTVQTQASSSPAGSGAASGQTGAAGWYHDGTGWRYRMPNGYDACDDWVWSDRSMATRMGSLEAICLTMRVRRKAMKAWPRLMRKAHGW